MIGLIILLTVLAHVVADFTLQGIMADMKQKNWWNAQFATVSAEQPDRDMDDIRKVYGYDYIAALLIHGIEWSILVTLPALVLSDWNGYWMYAMGMVLSMGVIHAFIDHLKANERMLNLVWDQALHVIQLAVILAYFLL